MVDAGLPWETRRLLSLIKDPPKALFLTHHHLDHAGGARSVWEKFRIPIYAHPKDIPYLTGKRRRPPLPIPLLGGFSPTLPHPCLRRRWYLWKKERFSLASGSSTYPDTPQARWVSWEKGFSSRGTP